MRDKMDELAVEAEHGAVPRLAQPHRAPDDGVEHRLDVGRRARDDPQDLARGGLLLERLRDLGMGLREGQVLPFQLGEQPDVLDGDDRLGGEGLRQRDLLVREGLDFSPPQDDDADGYAFAQERRGQHRPSRDAQRRCAFLRLGEFRLGSARMSSTWIVWRSRTARPATARGVTAMVPPIGIDRRHASHASRRAGETRLPGARSRHRSRRRIARRSRPRRPSPAGDRSASWR